jgi:hypothetical protein
MCLNSVFFGLLVVVGTYLYYVFVVVFSLGFVGVVPLAGCIYIVLLFCL